MEIWCDFKSFLLIFNLVVINLAILFIDEYNYLLVCTNIYRALLTTRPEPLERSERVFGGSKKLVGGPFMVF